MTQPPESHWNCQNETGERSRNPDIEEGSAIASVRFHPDDRAESTDERNLWWEGNEMREAGRDTVAAAGKKMPHLMKEGYHILW